MSKLIRRTLDKESEHIHYSKKGSGITALIDMDVIVYSVGFAAQSSLHKVRVVGKQGVATFSTKRELKAWTMEKELGPDDYTIETEIIPDPVENALHSVKVMLNSILERVGAEHYKGYLTGKGNFRDEVAVTQPYKGNRIDFVKPIHFQAIKDYLINVWGAVVIEGKEADDELATQLVAMGDKAVLCSIDKDLRMIKGAHYNWNKDVLDYISYEQGLNWFFTQWLMGDPTDNIKGLKGIGKKTAEKLLSGFSLDEQLCTVGLWYAIKEDAPEDRMQEDGNLLWVQREDGVQFDLHRIISGE